MAKVSINRRLPKMRRSVEALMPDTCRVAYPIRTIQDSGSWLDTYVYYTYQGNELIPCRVDPTRHYRKDDIFDQEVVPNEYMLVVPYDVSFNAGDRVEFLNVYYEISKIIDEHSWRVVNRYLIVELD